MKRLQPSEELAAIIGHEPMLQAQVVEGYWSYIRENGLQDARNPRRIKADENLGRIFGGQDQVTLFELTRLINGHPFVCPEAKQNRRNQRTASIDVTCGSSGVRIDIGVPCERSVS